MANPLLQGINQGITQNLSQIKNMMNMVRNAGNPNAMLNQMIQNNPQLKQVMDYVNQNGGDPQQAFYKMAQEKGINPDEILNQLR